MATDPPYLVDYQGGHHPASEANGGARDQGQALGRLHRPRALGRVLRRLPARRPSTMPSTEDAAVYQCFGIMRSEVIWQSWREVGLLAHQVLIWKKTRSVLTYCALHVGLRADDVRLARGHSPRCKPPADARAVWEIASKIEDGAGGVHPTQKPVELIRRPITYHTKPGGLLYEPFSGSAARRSSPPRRPGRHLLRHRAARRPSSTSPWRAGRRSPAIRQRRSTVPAPKTNRGAIAHGWRRSCRSSSTACRRARSCASLRRRPTGGGISPRTLDNYIARARRLIIEQAKVEEEEVYAQSLARKQRLFTRAALGNQLRTALAVQKEINRMFGNFSAEMSAASCSASSMRSRASRTSSAQGCPALRRQRVGEGGLCSDSGRVTGPGDLCGADPTVDLSAGSRSVSALPRLGGRMSHSLARSGGEYCRRRAEATRREG